jgi:uncharacterized protein (TIGR03435 family)
VSLRTLIEEAYQLKPFQLTGRPRWLDSDKFGVTAKGEESASVARIQSSWSGALSNHVTLRITSIAQLTDLPARQMDDMVEDETGLSGEFDFELDATRDESELNPFNAPYAPALSQVGLKLESRKGSVDIFIVDRAGKPSEN